MKMHRLLSALVILLTLLFVTATLFYGCGSGNSKAKPDTAEMLVADVTLPDGAVDVAVNSAVTVTFNKAPVCSEIDADTFTLKDSSDNNVPGSLNCDKSAKTLKFTPSASLNYNMTYMATLEKGVHGATENPLKDDYYLTFTTALDTTAPSISSMSPDTGATDVVVNSAITATFSEPVDPGTVNASTFTLSGGITGTVTYAGNTATFTPSGNLAYNTVYTR